MFQSLYGQILIFCYLSIIAAFIAIYFINSYAKKQREQFGKFYQQQ